MEQTINKPSKIRIDKETWIEGAKKTKEIIRKSKKKPETEMQKD